MSGQHFSMREFVARMQAESRLRQRVAALTGASVFFAAALIAVGLARVVLVAVGIAALAGVLALTPRSVPRDAFQRARRLVRLKQARQRFSLLAAGTAASARRQSADTWRRTCAIASTAVARAQRAPKIRETHAVGRAIPPPSGDELYGWPYAGSDEHALAPRHAAPPADAERRRALDLNACGAHLRRAGDPSAAATLHLEALEIFRSLNDRNAEAATLNGLALALAGSGDTDDAVKRFEQSLAILREHPDRPEQGKVIANLGFTLLRQGAEDRGRELLGEALEKLPPESPAAHKVEAQLRRAS